MFTENESRAIYDYLDVDKKRLVKISDIMDAFRRPLDEKCRRLLGLAFDRLDYERRGVVAAHDVAAGYDPSKHPEVVVGKRSAEEEYRDFLDSFEVGGEVEGCVTRAEFMDYFSNLAAALDDDDLFCRIITATWLGGQAEGLPVNDTDSPSPSRPMLSAYRRNPASGPESTSKSDARIATRHSGSEASRSKSELTNDLIFGRDQKFQFQPRVPPVTNLHHHHHAAIFPIQQPTIPFYSPERSGKRQIRLKKSDVIVLDEEQ